MNYRTSIGLDVHARSIRAAAFIPETGEIVERGFGYDAEAIAKWAKALPQPARAVYESGPTGFNQHADIRLALVRRTNGHARRPASTRWL